MAPGPPRVVTRSACTLQASTAGSARDRFLCGDGARREHVALQVAVVALGRADVGMAELSLDVHQRVAGREPRGGGGVTECV